MPSHSVKKGQGKANIHHPGPVHCFRIKGGKGRPLTRNPHPQVLQSWRKRTSREALAGLWLIWGDFLRGEGQQGW